MMITPPTTMMVTVCPMPHKLPIRAAPQALRCRLTIVDTAITWSASVACRMPRRKPSTITGRLVMLVARFLPHRGGSGRTGCRDPYLRQVDAPIGASNRQQECTIEAGSRPHLPEPYERSPS